MVTICVPACSNCLPWVAALRWAEYFALCPWTNHGFLLQSTLPLDAKAQGRKGYFLVYLCGFAPLRQDLIVGERACQVILRTAATQGKAGMAKRARAEEPWPIWVRMAGRGWGADYSRSRACCSV